MPMKDDLEGVALDTELDGTVIIRKEAETSDKPEYSLFR